MTKQALVKQAQKMNRDAIFNDRHRMYTSASLCRQFRDINMKHARQMA
jgi:hypothetical protein